MKTAIRHDEGKPDYTCIHPDVWAKAIEGGDCGFLVSANTLMNSWYYYGEDISVITPDYYLRETITRASSVLEFGAIKYDALNYTGGMNFSRVMKSFRRHTMTHARGEIVDIESKLPHISHAACNLLFAYTYMLNEALVDTYDDRPTALREQDNE